jgi:hypothetical protein
LTAGGHFKMHLARHVLLAAANRSGVGVQVEF